MEMLSAVIALQVSTPIHDLLAEQICHATGLDRVPCSPS